MPLNALLLVLVSATPDGGAPAGPLTDDEVAARARAVLAPLKKSLQEVTAKALEVGPDGGVEYFAKESQAAFKATSKGGVTAGWTSLQLRNQKNAPRAWVREVLRDFKMAAPGSSASKVVELPQGRRGYVEALWVKPACVTCHGDPIPPAFDERLKKRYPADESKGLWLNDLRGAFWVELEPKALGR